MTDVRDTLVKAEQLIKMLDKEVNQIMIEARIVTVDVGYSQSLGVSWGIRKNGGPNGNYFLEVQVRPHRFFRRRNDDIMLNISINIAQAALEIRVSLGAPLVVE